MCTTLKFCLEHSDTECRRDSVLRLLYTVYGLLSQLECNLLEIRDSVFAHPWVSSTQNITYYVVNI